jgi:hypothetical protein
VKKIYYIDYYFTNLVRSDIAFNYLHEKGYQVVRMSISGLIDSFVLWILSEDTPMNILNIREFIPDSNSEELKFDEKIYDIYFLKDYVRLYYTGGYQFDLFYDFSYEVLGILEKLKAPHLLMK